jgi:hypothetical protein
LDIPGQDDCAGRQPDLLRPRRYVGKVDEVIRAERALPILKIL